MSQEYLLSTDTVIVSTSDLQGNILTYNKAFIDASGYSESEIKGKSHSILRHSDMPKEAFQDLWQTIGAGHPWFGIVKNKRKNGDFYWVTANVSPIFDAGRITGYVSVRYPTSQEQKSSAEQLYEQLRRGNATMPWTKQAGLDLLAAAGIAIGLAGIALPYWLTNTTGLVVGSISCLIGFGLTLWRTYHFTKPSAHQTEAIHCLANGHFQRRYQGNDAWTNALNLLRTRIGQAASDNQDAARESAMLTTAMNATNTNLMVMDSHFKIISINKSLVTMLTRNEAALKATLPNFNVAQLVGKSCTIFHKDTDANLINHTSTQDMSFPGLHLRLTLVPIINQGKQLGYVAEWLDRTQEVLIERRINDALNKLSVGELDARINTAGLTGFTAELSNNINTAINTLSEAVHDVVTSAQALSHGNLTISVKGNYQGDLAKIKIAMNEAILSLNRSFGSVRNQASEVAQSAAQVSEANISLSQRIQEQAAALEQTAAAMEELTVQVQQSAQSASGASNLAETSSKEVRAGSVIMDQAITAMTEIQAVSSKITGIVSLIDSIAFQTNLLALNAAVEAARAGVHGRGFAVVASEVRALAGKSAEAAKDIKELIMLTAEKIHQGTDRVESTGEMLHGILGKFDQMVGLVSKISDNTNKQSQGLKQTNQAVAQIDKAVQQGATLVQENASLAQYLGGVASNLEHLVSAFELDEIQSQVVAEDTNNKSKALVVDDNLPSQKLAISLLKNNGYAVDAVSSGNQAIARSRNTAYQVILMDLNMQDGNGFSATKTLREQGCTARIIALTADKSLKQKALNLGANDFMVKPLRPEMLKQALQGKATANTTQKTLALPSPSNTSREWAEF